MRLVFMGSPDFAVPSLNRLAQGHEILAVYTQPPRPAGRGMEQMPTPVARAAAARGLAVFWPDNFADKAETDKLAALQAEAIIVVAYGLILPPAVLDIPPLGCINAHASLLPRWRGAAPIQRAIEAGDAKTGVCAMLMEAGLDTGPVLACLETEIPARMTAGQLHDQLARLAADCLEKTLADAAAGPLVWHPQPDSGVCYAAKISNQETELDLALPADQLARKIWAFDPVPGAWIRLAAGGRLKLADVQAGPASQLAPGCFGGLDHSGRMLVSCGQQTSLAIGAVQPPGKTRMPARDFLNGRQWQPSQLIWAAAGGPV